MPNAMSRMIDVKYTVDGRYTNVLKSPCQTFFASSSVAPTRQAVAASLLMATVSNFAIKVQCAAMILVLSTKPLPSALSCELSILLAGTGQAIRSSR